MTFQRNFFASTEEQGRKWKFNMKLTTETLRNNLEIIHGDYEKAIYFSFRSSTIINSKSQHFHLRYCSSGETFYCAATKAIIKTLWVLTEYWSVEFIYTVWERPLLRDEGREVAKFLHFQFDFPRWPVKPTTAYSVLVLWWNTGFDLKIK